MYNKVVLLFKLVAGDENTAGAPVKGAATRWQSEPTSAAFQIQLEFVYGRLTLIICCDHNWTKNQKT